MAVATRNKSAVQRLFRILRKIIKERRNSEIVTTYNSKIDLIHVTCEKSTTYIHCHTLPFHTSLGFTVIPCGPRPQNKKQSASHKAKKHKGGPFCKK